MRKLTEALNTRARWLKLVKHQIQPVQAVDEASLQYMLFLHFDVSCLEKCSPHNVLTTEELIAVDDDPGDVAEEKDDNNTD